MDTSANTRRGIEVMTAWLESEDPTGGHQLFVSALHANLAEGDEGYASLAAGLANVAAILLMEVSGLSGDEPRTILQRIAMRYGE